MEQGAGGPQHAASRITTIWFSHIWGEEEHFAAARLETLVGPEEHVRLNGLFGPYSQEHAKSDCLVVPFTFYNLPPDEGALMAEDSGREKWQSLAPFLLGG